MDFTKIKKLFLGGIELKQLFINGVQVWKSGPKNWVKFSTEADGVTIYNGGLGYKDSCRIRSGGAEQSSSNASCTGFIPFKKGDVMQIYPPFVGGNTYNAINFYVGDVVFGQVTHSGSRYGKCGNDVGWTQENIFSEKNGVTVLDISKVTNDSGIDRVRITNAIGAYGSPITTGRDMIITINEEIE